MLEQVLAHGRPRETAATAMRLCRLKISEERVGELVYASGAVSARIERSSLVPDCHHLSSQLDRQQTLPPSLRVRL